MNVWDVLILLAVAALIFLAVRAIRGGRAGCSCGGSCSGGCGGCPKRGSCTGCGKKDH